MRKKDRFIVGIVILCTILWGCVIYKFSDMNTMSSNGKSTDIIAVFLEKGLDFTNSLGITNSHPSLSKIEHASALLNSPLRKLMHASVYFVLSFLLIFVINMFFHNRKYLVSLLITVILCFSFALTDEYHQTFVLGRTGQFQDVIIDTCGGLVGALFYGTYYFVYRLGTKNQLVMKHAQVKE